MSVLNVVSTAPEPVSYHKLDLNGTGSSRNEYPVVDIWKAFDGNDDTAARGAFWGGGQGIAIDLGETKRIGQVRLVADVYEGPTWGHCTLTFGVHSLQTTLTERKVEKTWRGDASFRHMDLNEYARTFIYTIEVWEIVEETSGPPSIVAPLPKDSDTYPVLAVLGYDNWPPNTVAFEDLGAPLQFAWAAQWGTANVTEQKLDFFVIGTQTTPNPNQSGNWHGAAATNHNFISHYYQGAGQSYGCLLYTSPSPRDS